MSDLDDLQRELLGLAGDVDERTEDIGPHPNSHGPFGAGVHWLAPGKSEPWHQPGTA